jgi:predicted nucleotidyltransferase
MATLLQTGLAPQAVLGRGITEKRIQKKVAELVEAYHPLRVTAFGSWARGEARENSDLDLAVILDEASDRSKEEYDISGKSLPMSVDVLIVEKKRHQRLAFAMNTVHYDIATQGIVLYDREEGRDSELYVTPDRETLLSIKEESLRELLNMADADEKVLNIDGVPPQIAAFHGQQALEKLLKIWLTLIDVYPPRTHDLPELRDLLTKHHQQMPSLPVDLKEVTKYAVVWRYVEVPEAAHLDFAPLRQAAQLIRAHIVIQLAAKGITLA